MNMRLDFAASPPTFPIPHPSPRDLRPAFNPNSWPPGTIQNPPMFQQIAIQPTDQTQGSSSWSPWTDAHPRYPSREHTAMHQSQLYEHNRLLLTQRAQLAATTQRRAVDCGVCMDTFLEESIARIQPCGHPFCRDCVRRHVVSQMETRRFPVLCPTCTAEPGHKSKSIGKVTREMVLDIGITEEQYETWTEMEVSAFFIRLRCHRCNRSSFFDKQRLDSTRNLKCPFTDCNFVWCKSCQQEITPWNPEHPCDDGSSALKRLVHERGWKYCPTCRTPCEKISGCNLVACITPGCSSQFCYGCGELLSRAVPGTGGRNTGRCKCKRR